MMALLMREEGLLSERGVPRSVVPLDHPRTRSPAMALSALFDA